MASIDPETGDVVPLFNPRTEKWLDHLRLDGARLNGLTPKGRVTAELLRFNSYKRIVERGELLATGEFPRRGS